MEEKNKKRPFPPKEPTLRSSPPIKLKDRPNRDRIVLKLMDIWKFRPETMIINKVHGKNNTIIISAIVPEEVLKSEAEQAKKDRKKTEGMAKGKKKIKK